VCEVTTATMFWIALASSAATGAYTADASKKQGQYQAEVAHQNAALSDHKAAQAATIGSIQEERARTRGKLAIGQQRAAIAANGVDLGSGTAMDIVSDTALFGEEDALTTRFNAMNDAWGLRAQAVDYRNQGRAAKAKGKNEATGTYLTTGANMAGSYYNYKKGG
jgi:hypothetical protein